MEQAALQGHHLSTVTTVQCVYHRRDMARAVPSQMDVMYTVATYREDHNAHKNRTAQFSVRTRLLMARAVVRLGVQL